MFAQRYHKAFPKSLVSPSSPFLLLSFLLNCVIVSFDHSCHFLLSNWKARGNGENWSQKMKIREPVSAMSSVVATSDVGDIDVLVCST